MARPFFRRRKSCPFSGKGAPAIDYKDVRLLQGFMSERGKIVPSRITAVSGKKQRERDFAGTLEEGDSKKSVGVGPMKVQVTERTADWAEGLHHVLTSPFQASLKMARQKTARWSRPGSRRPPARETS